MIRSTMSDFPLTINAVLRHGRRVHAGSECVTFTGDGVRRATYRQVADNADRLAAALRRLGIGQGDPVGTFMWNDQEHLEAYFAVPCMGAVLHTLNIRLSREQLVYVTNHAGDRVVIVDASLLPVIGPVATELTSVEAWIVVGDGDTSALVATGRPVHRYDQLIAAEAPGFDYPEPDETAGAAMCYTSGTTGDPKGVVYSHRSTYLHSITACTPAVMGLDAGDRVLAIVPQFHANAWGMPYAAFLSGASLLMPGQFLQAEPIGEIEVRGPWVTASYWGDPAPAKFHDGWLRTGDVGTITSNGYLQITDRAKDVIKSGGEWISSVELENALMAHPGVVEAAVIGIPDPRWDERPLACVVADGEVAAEELQQFLTGRLAKWQVPENWAFVDGIPKTSVGKFDKKALRTLYETGELAPSRV